MGRAKYHEHPKKYSNIMTKTRIYCNCGHTINIPSDEDKVLCYWCGNYVFKTRKDEFEYRLQETMHKEVENKNKK